MPYAAPVEDMRFVDSTRVGAPLDGAVERDVADAILGEAARFAAAELDPLNQPADRVGSVLENGVVRTPPGFREAYRRYVEAGWMGLQCDPDYGGQGLPMSLATAVVEMWNSACMGWALCPLLNFGAIELLQAHGSPEQKQLYLDKLISGEWTGTMNLTEPQAGSDLGALRTRAVPARDERWGEHYRISGQKIFITYGDHDLTDNIVHMVLARTPDAPPGSRGISLFLVPKFLPDADGRPGERNDLRPLRVEEKLGIHASPTCVMSYGEDDGRGRLADRRGKSRPRMHVHDDEQRAPAGRRAGRRDRRTGLSAGAAIMPAPACRAMPAGMPRGGGPAPPIVHHPDVRRMLLSMRAATEAMRALTYLAAAAIDAEPPAAGDDKARFRAPAPGRPADPGGQGVVHRSRRRDCLDRHPGAWRDGLHRGDRRGAISTRRADRADLRRHQRHPGERSGRPQARPRPRRGGARAVRRNAADPVRDRRPGRIGNRCIAASPRGSTRWNTRPPTWSTPTRRSRRPARRPIWRCSARWSAAG